MSEDIEFDMLRSPLLLVLVGVPCLNDESDEGVGISNSRLFPFEFDLVQARIKVDG